MVLFCTFFGICSFNADNASGMITYRLCKKGLERVESVLKFHALCPRGGILQTWHPEKYIDSRDGDAGLLCVQTNSEDQFYILLREQLFVGLWSSGD